MNERRIDKNNAHNTPFKKKDPPSGVVRRLPKKIKKSIKSNAKIKNTIRYVDRILRIFNEEKSTDKNTGEKVDKAYDAKYRCLI